VARPTRYTPEIIEEYIKKGLWEPETLYDFWDRNARDCPHKEAVVDSRARLTWARAKELIDRLALGLAELGLGRDEVIVLQLPNCVEVDLLRVACERAGVLSLHVLTALRHREMEYVLRETEAVGVAIPWVYRDFDYFHMVSEIRRHLPTLRHIFVLGAPVPEGAISIEEMMQRPLERERLSNRLEARGYPPTEVSIITLTTGTTGLPKFVEFPFGARHALGRMLIEVLKLSGDDTVGAFGPAPAGPNCVAYFAAPRVAARVVFQERFEAGGSLRLIQDERVTVGLVVPAQLAMMVGHPDIRLYDLSSLRVWWCVGAPVPYQLRVDTEEKLGGIVLTGLGAVDFGGNTSTSLDDPRDVRLLTVGRPRGGTEIRLVDDSGRDVGRGEVGEVWGRGPSCASGYFRDPETTRQAWTEDGWFRMGDLGRFDEHGNLLIAGRKKDMLIRGGQNIYPVEVEDLLIMHPKVSDVAIVGMPDPVMGERACAYVVPKPGQQFTFEEMLAFLKGQGLAMYKLPERLEITDRLPLVGEQKVDRKALAADIAQKLRTESRT
jgi:non-ribosomal peptide synthetase component E (peptide arylation enzyme)